MYYSPKPNNISNISIIDINKCDALKRMIMAMRYYKLLKVENNVENKEILISFCQTVYTQLVNDYEHIINNHSQI